MFLQGNTIEEIPETTVAVNPQYRSLGTDVRRKVGILNRCRAKFCAIALTGEIEPKPVLVKTGKGGRISAKEGRIARRDQPFGKGSR